MLVSWIRGAGGAAALSTIVAMASVPAGAAMPGGLGGTQVVAPEATDDDTAPAAVLGLHSEHVPEGAALTQALRRAFAARGLSGGDDANLVELRLALGCTDDDPSCLARGGQVLGARRLIYGGLERSPDSGWALDLSVLEVDTVAVEGITVSLTDDDLSPAHIDATAERIADTLAPDGVVQPRSASGSLAEPSTRRGASASSVAADEAESSDEGRLVWGRRRPTPVWKSVALGTSASLFVLSLGATIGMATWLRVDGGFPANVIEEAEESLTDSNSLNDIDPTLPVDQMCGLAQDNPIDPDTGLPLGQDGQVRNSRVTQVCQQGDDVRRALGATAVVAALTGLATLGFTLSLFVHRRAPQRSAWRRHGMRLGAQPSRGGFGLHLGGRF